MAALPPPPNLPHRGGGISWILGNFPSLGGRGKGRGLMMIGETAVEALNFEPGNYPLST